MVLFSRIREFDCALGFCKLGSHRQEKSAMIERIEITTTAATAATAATDILDTLNAMNAMNALPGLNKAVAEHVAWPTPATALTVLAAADLFPEEESDYSYYGVHHGAIVEMLQAGKDAFVIRVPHDWHYEGGGMIPGGTTTPTMMRF
jgi:hypothetical protein